MKAVGIKPGAVLEHRRRGELRATCICRDEMSFEYEGALYTSLTGAARAAATTLGLCAQSVTGWVFWGLEKKESPTFTAEATS